MTSSGYISDGLTQSEIDSVQQPARFGATLNSLLSGSNLIVIGASVALGLAAVGSSYLAEFSRTTYAPPTSASSNCPSMDIQSVSDPDVNTRYSGALVQNTHFDQSLQNFSTVYNTNNGATTVSTTTQTVNPNNSQGGWWGPDEIDPDYTFNEASTIQVQGAKGWSLSVATGPSGLTEVLTNAQGAQISLNGSGVTTLADGTLVNAANPMEIVVTQKLNQGGTLTTAYSQMNAYFPAPQGGQAANAPYVNIEQIANGAVVANGAAVSLTLGASNALLALPCPSAATAGGVPNTSTAESGAAHHGDSGTSM